MIAAAPETPTEVRPLRLPDPALLFEARARRFQALAAGHAARDWLELLGRIADGQRAAVRAVPVLPVRAVGADRPLALDRLPRDGAWRRMLAVVLDATKAPGLPVATLDAVRQLSESGVSQLEALADGVLAGNVPADRVATAPFIAAALQAWFTALAAGLDPAALPRAQRDCPVCGAPPVAGIVQGNDRLRYLTCSLCSAEWHLARIHCAACGGNAGITYLHVEGDEGARAEACGSCRSYLKLFDLEKRPGADALADDAATIALDLLMADDGWLRAGLNPLVAVGAGA